VEFSRTEGEPGLVSCEHLAVEAQLESKKGVCLTEGGEVGRLRRSGGLQAKAEKANRVPRGFANKKVATGEVPFTDEVFLSVRSGGAPGLLDQRIRALTGETEVEAGGSFCGGRPDPGKDAVGPGDIEGIAEGGVEHAGPPMEEGARVSVRARVVYLPQDFLFVSKEMLARGATGEVMQQQVGHGSLR
jgi:hypothetical protein